MKLEDLIRQLRATSPTEAARITIVEALRQCEERDGAKARLVRIPPDLAHRLLEGQYPAEGWPQSFVGIPLEVVRLPAFVLCEIVTARGGQAAVEI